MAIFSCEICSEQFDKKSHLGDHLKRKNKCKPGEG